MKKPVLALVAAALSVAALAPAASADIIVMASPVQVIDLEDAKPLPRHEPRPLPFPMPIVLPLPHPVPLPDSCLSCPPMPLPYTPITRSVILR